MSLWMDHQFNHYVLFSFSYILFFLPKLVLNIIEKTVPKIVLKIVTKINKIFPKTLSQSLSQRLSQRLFQRLSQRLSHRFHFCSFYSVYFSTKFGFGAGRSWCVEKTSKKVGRADFDKKSDVKYFTVSLRNYMWYIMGVQNDPRGRSDDPKGHNHDLYLFRIFRHVQCT